MHQRQLRRLKEIVGFFNESIMIRLLIPVATATFDVSLRLLDYCCTNYAKKTRVVICEDGIATGESYANRRALPCTSSPCTRTGCATTDGAASTHFAAASAFAFKIHSWVPGAVPGPRQSSEWLDTTVAQLNFLRWADVYKVIAYVRRNLSTLEQDMMLTLTEPKKRRQHRCSILEDEPRAKRKRTELSKAPRSKCTVYLVPRNLVFEK